MLGFLRILALGLCLLQLGLVVATPQGTTKKPKPVTDRSIWGIRAFSSPNFLQIKTWTKGPNPSPYFEAVMLPQMLTYRWVFYETPDEALLGLQRYWTRNYFRRLEEPYRLYLLRWDDDGEFWHVWNRDRSYDHEALHSRERILPPPSNVYQIPGYLQRKPEAYQSSLQVLNDIFTHPVPAVPNADPSLHGAVATNIPQIKVWFGKMAIHLNARCPANDAQPRPSTSKAVLTQRCAQYIAHTIENDLPWVQNWVQQMADAAGLTCEKEDPNRASCSNERCDTAVAHVLAEDPEFVKRWAMDMAASLDLNCIKSDAQPDPHCSTAIDNDTWIREMIQLLLYYAGIESCSDDSALANDVLQYLQDNFELSREQLMSNLAQGPQWLRQNFPQLLAVLSEFTMASLVPANCFQKSHAGKRALQRRDTAQRDILCRELLSGITQERQKVPGVYACIDESSKQACSFVKSNIDECVVLTQAWDKHTSSVRPGKTAGHCTLFSGHDCSGSGISTRFPGMSRGKEGRPVLSNKIGSLRCDGTKTAAAQKVGGCTHFDSLTVRLKLGSGWGTGTWSKIYYSLGESRTLLLAAHGPHGGSCIETKINMTKAFESAKVAASYINSFTIWDIIDSAGIVSHPATLGGDEWLLENFRIDAHCADAPKTLVYQAHVNEIVSHDKLRIDMPTPVKSVSIEPRDWVAVSKHLPETCQIGFADSEKHPTHECTEMGQLQLEIQLGNGYYQGTWDSLYFNFQDNEKHFIVSSPSPGFHEHQELDLQKVFKASKVAFNHLRLAQIYQYHDSISGNDDWKLKGIKLKARCANSLTEYQLDKFAAVNYAVTDMHAVWHTSWRAWSAAIDPQKDWNQVFECSQLDQLSASIYLGDKWSGGTWDDLFIRFETGSKHEFLLATQPSHDTTYNVEIDMNKAFQSPVVPVGKLEAFSILSNADQGNSPDEWRLGTVVLHARCAGSKKQLVHDTFQVDKWYERHRSFQSKISLRGWHLADASGNRAGAPGDF
ncbi:hypothetical protein CDD81_5001 [Ophiocordyceps australis]|uniref:Uncharacterized protein n=1 Tax=Ophiocordyceps australis TaxID=1399860 RepID=A0A2C5Y8T8_9HYPO|nr:hypothetical protein CDD81_5001 [Ophiocordyceps australis]